MFDRACSLLTSLFPSLLLSFAFMLEAILVTIDAATIHTIAIAIVWIYFEVQRRNDMRKAGVIADDKATLKATPLAVAMAHLTTFASNLEAKSVSNAGRITNLEAKAGSGDDHSTRSPA